MGLTYNYETAVERTDPNYDNSYFNDAGKIEEISIVEQNIREGYSQSHAFGGGLDNTSYTQTVEWIATYVEIAGSLDQNAAGFAQRSISVTINNILVAYLNMTLRIIGSQAQTIKIDLPNIHISRGDIINFTQGSGGTGTSYSNAVVGGFRKLA